MSNHDAQVANNPNVRLEIITPQKMYVPVIIGPVKWTWNRQGAPGTLEVTVAKDEYLNYQNGAIFVLKYKNKPIFRGFCFSKKRSLAGGIRNTVYDQTRYLKNKTSYQIMDTNAEGVISWLLRWNNLPDPVVEGVSDIRMPRKTLENKEILEIIDYVIAEHVIASGETLVFYDDAGTLHLKNIEAMKVTDQIFNPNEVVDWDYETTIDRGTYNSIYVTHEGTEGGEATIVAKDDLDRIEEWGVLRYSAKSNELLADVERKAEDLLKTLSREVRSLKIKKALGNPKVRGGSLVAVNLPLGDMNLVAWMIVKEVTHTISGNQYTMDMVVENRGLGFAEAVSPEGVFKVIETRKVGSASGGRLPGNTNAEIICNKLLDLGFTLEAACGILGNIDRETGGTYDPTIIQNGGKGPGRGLCQWESAAMGGSGRWEQLVEWCRGNGYNENTIDGQLAFLKHELTSPTSWVNTTAMPTYAGMKGTDYLNLTDVDKATEAFIRGYEIPADPSGGYARSVGPARTMYNQYKTALASGGTGTGTLTRPILGTVRVSSAHGSVNPGRPNHLGTDYAVPIGTPILAADGGRVTHSGTGEDWTYGRSIVIEHGNGFRTRYAHLNSEVVKAGDAVTKGQVIGHSGITGNSDGPHLHFEVYHNGRNVNPEAYI